MVCVEIGTARLLNANSGASRVGCALRFEHGLDSVSAFETFWVDAEPRLTSHIGSSAMTALTDSCRLNLSPHPVATTRGKHARRHRTNRPLLMHVAAPNRYCLCRQNTGSVDLAWFADTYEACSPRTFGHCPQQLNIKS